MATPAQPPNPFTAPGPATQNPSNAGPAIITLKPEVYKHCLIATEIARLHCDPVVNGNPPPTSNNTTRDEAIKTLFEDTLFRDVYVIAGSGSATKKFFLHRLVLASQSEFFKIACKPNSGFRESDNGEVKLPSIAPHTFEHIIAWIYEGIGPLEHNYHTKCLKTIFEAANMLIITPLRNAIILKLSDADFEFPTAGADDARYNVELVNVIFRGLSNKDREGARMDLIIFRLLKSLSIADVLEIFKDPEEGKERWMDEDFENKIKAIMGVSGIDVFWDPKVKAQEKSVVDVAGILASLKLNTSDMLPRRGRGGKKRERVETTDPRYPEASPAE